MCPVERETALLALFLLFFYACSNSVAIVRTARAVLAQLMMIL